MFELLYGIASRFWSVLSDMAPYLILGFIVAGILSVTVSTRLIERHLGGRGFWTIVKASLLGIPLPLCSCGVIPVAASLRRKGASRGATTSFLLSTPQTGVDSILVTLSLLGPVFAIFRPLVALVTGLLSGKLVEMFADREPEDVLPAADDGCQDADIGLYDRAAGALRYGFIGLPQDIGRPLVLGLVIAGVISAAVPDDFFLGLLGAGIGSMLLMLLLGVPIYVCATASVPIAAALLAKGISPGAALVFMVSGPAVNAATIITIWRILGRRTTIIYLAVVVAVALASGLLLDKIVPVAGGHVAHEHHSMLPEWLETICAIAVVLILVIVLLRPYASRYRSAKPAETEPSALLRVDGMTCRHCATTVSNALLKCRGVESVDVDLKGRSAAVFGKNLDLQAMKTSVEEAGYTVPETDSK